MPLPPGPRDPSIVQTWRWMRRPTEFMESCAARHGEIFTARLKWDGTLVMISEPDAIRQVFAATYDDVSQPKSPQFTELLGRTSLFTLEGQAHLRMRRLVMPTLQHDRARAHARVLHEVTAAAIDAWPLGARFYLQSAMQDLVLVALLHVLLGERSAARLEALRRLFSATSATFASRFMLVPIDYQRWLGRGPWLRLINLTSEARRIFGEEITDRRRSGAGGGGDVLSLLLQTRDGDGLPMTDEELCDTLIALLVAGHDTTANAMSWALSHLLRPDARDLRDRLREEIATAEEGGALVPDLLTSLPLLDATVREVLRLHPIFPAVRRDLARPMSLLGYDLPIGTKVVPCIYLAQRRAAAFPDPGRFLPERFLEGRPSAFEWFPFGGGIRRCVGSAAVPVQMKVMLATILHRAALRALPGPPVRTVRWFIALAPSGGVPAILDARAAPTAPG